MHNGCITHVNVYGYIWMLEGRKGSKASTAKQAQQAKLSKYSTASKAQQMKHPGPAADAPPLQAALPFPTLLTFFSFRLWLEHS